MNEQNSKNEQELEKTNALALVRDLLRSFRRLWLLVLALTVGVAALFYFRTTSRYTPRYVAEVTVSVELVNGGTYANRTTAEQMGAIFPYILSSGALSDVIAADMGTKGVPGSIWANNIKGTNLLTISASSSNPETAYRIVQSALKSYPEVAQYVVGQTAFTVIDDGGIPSDTGRTAVVRGSLKKGALIGLAIGLAIVVLRALTFRTISSEEELKSILNVDCLGTLPVCSRKHRRKDERSEINILYDSNRGNYIEAMRLIRTRLERRMEDGKKVVMVTSSVAGEGKSTVAANLAISMALKGKKVILVDCDLRNPSVGNIFDLRESCPGLVAVLDGKVRLEEALYEISNDGERTGLTLLPGADKASNLVEILGSQKMKDLIERLKEMADIVVLDTPPSAVLVDAAMLVKHVDTIAYVIMCDYARRRYIMDGVQELSGSGTPVAGCILNGGRAHSSGYGYYGYYGKYGYGKYGYGKYGYGKYGYGGYGHYYGYGSENKKKK
ncbi:MAG: polysaccharide biosynthesis tyrosine autokinase [Clostridiales bacterium]|nr:polysaccharide biosynthesis tyrosine autokinase [Clostridiales bacterium]